MVTPRGDTSICVVGWQEDTLNLRFSENIAHSVEIVAAQAIINE